VRRIEDGELRVVGQNSFTSTEQSPLQEGEDGGILTVDPEVEQGQIEAVREWRSARDQAAVDKALAALAEAARDESVNIMPATLECARAGATTGEWAGALREVFGEYRAPTGVSGAPSATDGAELRRVREAVRRTADELGGRLRVLIAKPGLDGHSNGAEQIAVRARDSGFEVVYQGIRLTPDEIVAAAVAEDVHLVGVSILSGSHLELVPAIVEGLRAEGLDDVPVVVGGIIPPADADELRGRGVAAVFTPKDFELTQIMAAFVDEIRAAHGLVTGVTD
jgi:(2R)-ethylmalonyl-CoA mutase